MQVIHTLSCRALAPSSVPAPSVILRGTTPRNRLDRLGRRAAPGKSRDQVLTAVAADGAGSNFSMTLTYRQVMNVWELLYLPGLDDSLARVEAELRQAVTCPEPLLSEVASHLVSAGGKRLRPALSLASAAATGSSATLSVVQGAVSVELVHMDSCTTTT